MKLVVTDAAAAFEEAKTWPDPRVWAGMCNYKDVPKEGTTVPPGTLGWRVEDDGEFCGYYFLYPTLMAWDVHTVLLPKLWGTDKTIEAGKALIELCRARGIWPLCSILPDDIHPRFIKYAEAFGFKKVSMWILT